MSCCYLRKLYANQPPQFIYYLTLFHLFRDYLDGTRDVDDNLRRVALPDTRIWRTLFYVPEGRRQGGHQQDS